MKPVSSQGIRIHEQAVEEDLDLPRHQGSLRQVDRNRN
jgi:hypothetical protein